MNTHVFEADWALPADHKGRRPCTCGLPEGNTVHQVPATPVEVAQVEARKLGEDV